MTDVEHPAPEVGLPPILLLGNSYSLPDLMKAADHLAELKTERGREENAARIPEKLAINQDVIAGLQQQAVPPDHTLRYVEDLSGKFVQGAVPNPVYEPSEDADPDADDAREEGEKPDSAPAAADAQDPPSDAAKADDPGPDAEAEEPAAPTTRRKRATTAPSD